MLAAEGNPVSRAGLLEQPPLVLGLRQVLKACLVTGKHFLRGYRHQEGPLWVQQQRANSPHGEGVLLIAQSW